MVVQFWQATIVGTFASGSDYNISDVDASDAPNATFTDDYATVTFVDENNSDFHLSQNDTAAVGKGVNLSSDAYLPFNVDIDGDARGSWDIGADEMTDIMGKMKGDVKLRGDVKFK